MDKPTPEQEERIENWKAHYNNLRRDVDNVSTELSGLFEEREEVKEELTLLIQSVKAESGKLFATVDEIEAVRQGIISERESIVVARKSVDLEKEHWVKEKAHKQKEVTALGRSIQRLVAEEREVQVDVKKVKKEIKVFKKGYGKQVKKHKKLLSDIAQTSRDFDTARGSRTEELVVIERGIITKQKEVDVLDAQIAKKSERAKNFRAGLLKAREQVMIGQKDNAIYNKRLRKLSREKFGLALPGTKEVEIPEVPDIK